ncbi:MAG: hypothetical protein ACR652_04240 [Methylocystis sp.]|uniref:hypothetical protein n=1 Tax=Methylocystis sp. TaxID=1911079 RepID=UPI003DA684FC
MRINARGHRDLRTRLRRRFHRQGACAPIVHWNKRLGLPALAEERQLRRHSALRLNIERKRPPVDHFSDRGLFARRLLFLHRCHRRKRDILIQVKAQSLTKNEHPHWQNLK